MKLAFTNHNGTFPRRESSLISEYMRKTKGKFIRIEYTAVKPTRSLLQNAYYWSVIVKMLSEELGYEIELMHEIIKRMFLEHRSIPMPDATEVIVTQSTTDLTTVEFEDFTLRIRIWARDFLMMYIPLPNETNFNYYEVQ